MRNTRQKKIIMDALSLADHPTATELFEALQMDYPSLSRGTVFRVLAQFADSGEITKICADGSARFDACTKPHAHAVCERCGRVYDVCCDEVCAALNMENYEGFEINSASVIYTGICKNCK